MPDASKLIDASKLDRNKLIKYKAIDEVVDTLDKWILLPDMHLVSKLKEYAPKLESIARLPVGTKLYRGFDPKSHYQDVMGLAEKNWFTNKVKPHAPGDIFEYSLERPLSFTTDMDIAMAFGKTVVELVSLPERYIWITDELSMLISVKRNIEPETQNEVILLPPYNATLKVIKS